MAKKVDVSFMKFVTNDDEWKREVVDGGDKQICSKCKPSHAPPVASRSRAETSAARALIFCIRSCHSFYSHAILTSNRRLHSCLLLLVIDVYTELWGPCEMIAGHFNSMFYDLGEVYGMKFIRARSDKVTALKEYTGESAPTFLFYLGGALIDNGVVNGSNLPKIVDIVKTQAPKL